MDLFTLSKFFGNRYELIELYVDNTSELEVGDYVSLYGEEALVLRKGHGETATDTRAEFVSEASKRRYKECVKTDRQRHFSCVLGKKDKTLQIGMLYGINILQDRLLMNGADAIAVVDEALGRMTLLDFAGRFYTSYQYSLDGEKYYVCGKSIYADGDAQGFILVDVERNTYLTVNLKSIAGLFPEDNDKTGDMLVIEAQERKLTQIQNYVYSLRNIEFRIVDKTERQRASALNTIFVKAGGDKYIGLWKRYAEAEYDGLMKQQEAAGELEFSHICNLKDNCYLFTIDNATQVYAFTEIANKHFGGRVLVSIEAANGYKVRGEGEIIENWAASEKDRNGICLRMDEPIVLGERFSGLISLNIRGGEVQYERRKKAIDAILSGSSNNQCLAMILNGKTAARKQEPRQVQLRQDILQEIFGKKGPNESQRDAIEMALNTPDYAIIQGPPGTGKTRVIRAILSHLQAESGVSHDKRFLITAYQNEATRNAVRDMNDYLLGLPIFSSAGKDADEQNRQDMESWCSSVRDRVFNANPQLLSLISKREKIARLSGVCDRLSGKCGMRTACGVLQQALDEVNKINAEIKSDASAAGGIASWAMQQAIESDRKVTAACKNVERILREWKRTLETEEGEVKYYISLIPTTPKCFEDCGKQQLAKVIDYFTIGVGSAYRDIFVQQLNALREVSARAEWKREDYAELNRAQIHLTLAMSRELSPSDESAKAAVCALNDCIDALDNVRTTEMQEILYDFVMEMYPSVDLYEAIEKYGVSFSATHQKSLSEEYGFLEQIDSAETANSLPVYDDILVDEAARSCPPDLMIPLACTRDRIVLVGDDKQLPQFLNEDTVHRMNLDEKETQELLSVLNESSLVGTDKPDAILKVSMFEYLAKRAQELCKQDNHERVIMLNKQYRMPPTLGRLISKHFYNNMLENGNENVAEFRQNYDGIAGYNMLWLQVPATEYGRHKGERSFFREAEKNAILAVLRKIKDGFVKENRKKAEKDWAKIGIIAAYKAQANLIEEALENEEWADIKDCISVGTVDSFQGREFDIVFFSLVKTGGGFGFLNTVTDKEGNNHAGAARTCVALSRAKKCMIIVGDDAVLTGKNQKDAQEQVPAVVDFYAACKEKRDNVCGYLRCDEI